MFINQLKIFKMKLIKITQFGFYSGIDSEKYIVTNLEKLVKYINAYLLREYGNYEYADILDQFILDGYYFRGKIVDGLGEISIEVMGDVEVNI